MGIKSVKLRPGSRRGPVLNKDGSYTYQQTYVVRTTSTSDDGTVVVKATGLPVLGTTFPNDASALVTKIDPQQQEEDSVWYVTVTWEHPAPNKQQDEQPGGAPAFPQRDWTSTTYAEYPLKDLDGKPFRNAAGDPFDPAVAILKSIRVLTITVPGLRRFNVKRADEYLDAINSDPITVDGKTYPPFSGLLTVFDGRIKYLADGTPSWNVTIQIEFKKDLWQPHKVLNKGPRYLLPIPNAPLELRAVWARDDNEVVFGGDVLLKADGTRLPKDDTNVTWIEFKVKEAKNFGQLNLPLG